MKKFILAFVFFVTMALSAVAQKSFVGQTKQQVKDFWKTEVSSNYFEEGTWDDTQLNWFMVCTSCSGGSYAVMNPEFIANFEPKTGKCVKSSFRIPSENISVFVARFKKLGYVPDIRKGTHGWTDKKRGEFWTIEGNYRAGHSLAVYKW